MLRKIKKGFTLVELVVVIAVVAILAAVSVVAYVSISNKAEQSADEQTIDQYNSVLRTEEVKTPYQAFDMLEKNGVILENAKPLVEGGEYAYNLRENKVVVLKDNKIVYPTSLARDLASRENDIWRIAKTNGDVNNQFSWYLSEACSGSFNVNTGLDVGKNEDVSAVTYTNAAGPAQQVVIRTNSKDAIVNATAYESGDQCDTIKHFGDAAEVNISNAGNHSFHEYGSIAFLFVAQGRAVLELNSRINTVVSGKPSVVIQSNGAIYVHAYGIDHCKNDDGNVPLDQIAQADVEEKKEEAESEVNPREYVEADDPEGVEGLTYTEYNTGNINTWEYMVFGSKNIKLTSSVTIDNEDGPLALLSGTVNFHLNHNTFVVGPESGPAWVSNGTMNIYGKGQMALYDPYAAAGCLLMTGGTVNIFNGTFGDNSPSDTKLFGVDGGSLNIYSGTFYGRIVPKGGSLTIHSGIFRNSGFTVDTIKQYVASGSIVTTASDGAIVVIK